MKKLLTYILWSSTKYLKQPKQRYWNNIPYLLVANSCLFPDFHMRFYVHKDSIDHPFFIFLEEISREFPEVELKVLSLPYKGTQLTVQRMEPLWEKDVEYLFCRDMDYAVSSLERKCMDHFMEQNECLIHSIRSRHSHSNLPLYAGLCGFNVKRIFEKIGSKTSSFKKYIRFASRNDPSYKKGSWLCDQILLRDFFCSSELDKVILDCPQLKASLRVETGEYFPQGDTYRPVLCKPIEYSSRKIVGCDARAVSFLDKLFVSPSPWNKFKPFIGRGWTCSSEDLRKLIRLANSKISRRVRRVFMNNFGKIDYEIDNSGQWSKL